MKIDISGEEYLYDVTKDEKKKKLWAKAQCGNIWRGQDSRGGEMCEGAGKEKKTPSMQKTAKISKKGQG